MTQAFSPTEIFKRATASTLRAIAERDDLTVGFGPEPPGLSGSRVKLPNPARDLPPDEAAQLRGAADLSAMLDEQYRRQGFERVTERTESTMAEAVRLLTREALTHEPPPPAAKNVVDLWRPWLEGKIGRDIAELDR